MERGLIPVSSLPWYAPTVVLLWMACQCRSQFRQSVARNPPTRGLPAARNLCTIAHITVLLVALTVHRQKGLITSHSYEPLFQAFWMAEAGALVGRPKPLPNKGLPPLPGLDLMQYPTRGLAPPATCFGPSGAEVPVPVQRSPLDL